MTEPNSILIRARFNAGLSQESLASKAGIAPLTLRRLEQNKFQRPHPQTAKAIADQLDLLPTDLFALDDLDQEEGLAS